MPCSHLWLTKQNRWQTLQKGSTNIADTRGDGLQNRWQTLQKLSTKIADTRGDGLQNRLQKLQKLSTQIADTRGDGLQHRCQNSKIEHPKSQILGGWAPKQVAKSAFFEPEIVGF